MAYTKRTLISLVLLAPLGCQAFQEPLKDPLVVQSLETMALSAAEKAALRIASEFQITDQSATKRLVDEAKTASAAAVNQAVQRFEAQDKVARQQWREQTRETIAASLQGVGGALAVTGNPILMGLGLLMGIGGILTSPKKKKEGTP